MAANPTEMDNNISNYLSVNFQKVSKTLNLNYTYLNSIASAQLDVFLANAADSILISVQYELYKNGDARNCVVLQPETTVSVIGAINLAAHLNTIRSDAHCAMAKIKLEHLKEAINKWGTKRGYPQPIIP